MLVYTIFSLNQSAGAPLDTTRAWLVIVNAPWRWEGTVLFVDPHLEFWGWRRHQN
jgi:hypothetical protein